MYLGTDIHKRYAQVAVMDEDGKSPSLMGTAVSERLVPRLRSQTAPHSTDRMRIDSTASQRFSVSGVSAGTLPKQL